jgi:hypothetical protein
VNINTQRGQESGWATLNPISSFGSPTISNGNLTFAASGASYQNAPATLFFTTTNKYYWEVTLTKLQSGADNQQFAIGDIPASSSAGFTNSFLMYAYYADATYRYGPSGVSPTSLSVTSTTGDVLEFAYDGVSGKVWFGVNGIWFLGGNPATNSNPIYTFASIISRTFSVIHYGTTGISAVNFGQKPFKFPPPAGFQPLALANTPRPSIVRPDKFMGVVTYTGNGGTQTISGLGFSPDLVWIKERGGTNFHMLFDTIRGANVRLNSNSTNPDYTETTALTSFDSAGFSMGGNIQTNGSSQTYVAWCWKAGGNSNTFNIDDVGYDTASAAGLTAGTITPTGASVNTKSGFSIIKYTGTGANATVGHGLGVAPQFLVVKARSASGESWIVYHAGAGMKYGVLNATNVFDSNTGTIWNSTAPTSSVFSLGNNTAVNGNGTTYVCYAFAPVAGYSAMGSYVGNGSSDGPMVYTGFRIKWLLLKNTTSSGDMWFLLDSSRDPENPNTLLLQPNTSDQEFDNATNYSTDLLSNGFKLRSSTSRNNSSGDTFIYIAFAETPTQNLYGAQSNAR